jgi:hypothetical protein
MDKVQKYSSFNVINIFSIFYKIYFLSSTKWPHLLPGFAVEFSKESRSCSEARHTVADRDGGIKWYKLWYQKRNLTA